MAHVYKRGQQYWISYYLDGNLRQKSLKTKNERVALSKKKQIEYELSIGDLHIASRLPLPVLLETFCKHLQNIRTRKSYKNDISRLRVFFGPVCESLKPYPSSTEQGGRIKKRLKDKYEKVHVKAELLEDISPEMINKFLADRMAKDSWKPKTVNLLRQTLHKLFSYAIKYQGFRSRDRRYPNPAAGVERMREAAPHIQFLGLEEIPAQLEAVQDSPVIHTLVATYIYAGVRREEALWLTPEDVDLQQRLIRVRAKTVKGEYWQPKTKRNRVVPISNQLFEILNNYHRPKDSLWFFPSPKGSHWDPDNFSQDLRNLNQKAGLSWSCLDFRHTFGSQLAQKGESLYKISELMGNSPDICRKHYAALIPEKMKDTVEFGVSAMPQENKNNENMEAMLKQILEKLDGGNDLNPQIRLVR
jgi:integrase